MWIIQVTSVNKKVLAFLLTLRYTYKAYCKLSASYPFGRKGHKSNRGGDFVKKYEIMFIVKSVEDEVVNAMVEKVENLITKNGGTVEKVDRWGKRRLAYEVKKTAEGYYVLINFDADPAIIAEIDRVMKITDEILKHMIVKNDK